MSDQSDGPPAEPQTQRTITFAGHEWGVKHGDLLLLATNYVAFGFYSTQMASGIIILQTL